MQICCPYIGAVTICTDPHCTPCEVFFSRCHTAVEKSSTPEKVQERLCGLMDKRPDLNVRQKDTAKSLIKQGKGGLGTNFHKQLITRKK